MEELDDFEHDFACFGFRDPAIQLPIAFFILNPAAEARVSSGEFPVMGMIFLVDLDVLRCPLLNCNCASSELSKYERSKRGEVEDYTLT